jgi:carboxy-terminal domain RNA polymerase II polypeptide A small phosphatase
MDDRLLLILDLDETLVYAVETPIPGRSADHVIEQFHIYFRPGLLDFLQQVSACYRLAVWTSSSPLYAQVVCGLIFPPEIPLEFVWASDRCTTVRDLDTDLWINSKPLRKIIRSRGGDLGRILIVDDSPEKLRKNYGNLVPVIPFEGDQADDELRWLAVYLKQLSSADDVRRIEKRIWRRKVDPNVSYRS